MKGRPAAAAETGVPGIFKLALRTFHGHDSLP
jgi:hypothetical protein